MARSIWSLKIKVSVAAAALLVVGLGTTGGLSYLAMKAVSEQSHDDLTTRAVKEGIEALRDVRARMGVYTSVLARHPDIVAAVRNNNPAELEAVLVREFKSLHAADPTVASLEATDAKGVIIMRGHNPPKKGDAKGGLPQIKAALAGQPAGGLTVSPTSGEAAEDSVRPVRSGDSVIGTLKIGSYFKAATAEELKKKTGLEVVFVAGGKVTEFTFGKDVVVAAPAELIGAARSGAPVAFATEINGIPFAGRFVHLPGDSGDGMVIGFFADRSGVDAAKSAFLSSLSLKGALALALILPVVLVLAHLATRQLLRLAAVMRRLADGDIAVAVPYAGNADEIGVMARTIEVFKANAAERLRLESGQREADARSAAGRKAELHRLADDFQGVVGTIVEAVSAAATELEAAAATLTQTAATTQSLSATVTRASEDASASAQSVASSTDQLTGSVDEIARQVNEFEHHRRRGGEPGGKDRRADRRAVAGGRPDRRRGQADRGGGRADQPAGAQRHDRGGARRRGGARFCGGRPGGQGARRADRKGDRRDRHADCRHADGDP